MLSTCIEVNRLPQVSNQATLSSQQRQNMGEAGYGQSRTYTDNRQGALEIQLLLLPLPKQTLCGKHTQA